MLGNPVSHSLSPLIQNTALARLEKDGLVYLATEIPRGKISEVIKTLPCLGAVGANVTVPYKLQALEACDVLSERAKAIGAVNILSFRQGQIFGDNSDGVGWLRALPDGWLKEDCDLRVLVLGAGGASRAVVATLLAWGCPEVIVLNRTAKRAEQLVSEMESRVLDGTHLACAGLEEFWELLQPGCLVVQTTSVGLDRRASPVSLSGSWPKGANFSELIYGEPTPMAKWVSERGGGVQDGLPMLIHQAAESLSVWLDIPVESVPVDEMLRAARMFLAS